VATWKHFKYLVYQEEVGEHGTHHLQGYVETTQPVKFTNFKGLEGAHFEKPKGSPDQNEEYCTKEETRVGGPYRFGQRSKGSGERTDLLALRDAVKGGKRGREIFDDDAIAASAIKYARGVDKMVEHYTTVESRSEVRVTFHYGPAGTGKTFCCHSDDAYYFDGSNGFWIGYQGEKKIILDEFGGHCLSPLMFQRLCDAYKFMCNVKGGFVPCQATEIHITSNYMPDRWWNEKTKYNHDAVARRIHEVHYHDKYGHYFRFVHRNDGDRVVYAIDQLVEKLAKERFVTTVIA